MNFGQPKPEAPAGLSTGVMVAILVVVLLVIAVVGYFLWGYLYSEEEEDYYNVSNDGGSAGGSGGSGVGSAGESGGSAGESGGSEENLRSEEEVKKVEEEVKKVPFDPILVDINCGDSPTESGYTSIKSNSTINVANGVEITLGGYDCRLRGNAQGLNKDFVFSDEPLYVTIKGLPKGNFNVTVWAFDNCCGDNTNQFIIGYRKSPNGSDNDMFSGKGDGTSSLGSFILPADGTSSYEIYSKNYISGKSHRLNALSIKEN